MAFRSGLEEKFLDLMVELNVKYEYEPTRIPYEIQFNYTYRLRLRRRNLSRITKDYGNLKIDESRL